MRKQIKKNSYPLISLMTLVISSVLMTSCGSKNSSVSGSGSAVNQQTSDTGSWDNGDGGSDNGNNNNGGNDNSNNLQTPLKFRFNITGVGGTQPQMRTPEFNTDALLRIKVIPGPAGQISIPGGTYSNFNAPYSCVSYTITVNGESMVTQPLSQEGPNFFCPNARPYQVLDFSSRLTRGHGPLKIKVSNARYDYYCRLWYAGYMPWTPSTLYCNDLYTVYKTHTVTGKLEVQINGTYLDE